jgi:hypothetical protein
MEHLSCSWKRHLCQICLEKEYQDNITKLRKGGDYIDDKIHKDFMNNYEEYKKEIKNKNKIKNEKKDKTEKRKNVGSTISKKFNRLMVYDNYNKIKKTKLLLEAAATCNKLVELEQGKKK